MTGVHKITFLRHIGSPVAKNEVEYRQQLKEQARQIHTAPEQIQSDVTVSSLGLKYHIRSTFPRNVRSPLLGNGEREREEKEGKRKEIEREREREIK